MALMATYQDGSNRTATANTVAAMRRSAERRRCRKCGRKSAMVNNPDGIGRYCRWCGYDPNEETWAVARKVRRSSSVTVGPLWISTYNIPRKFDNGIRWFRVSLRLRSWHQLGGVWVSRRWPFVRVLLPDPEGPSRPLPGIQMREWDDKIDGEMEGL